MITVDDLSLQYSGAPLFSKVNLQFTPGNCYGIIGANGAGKSTFLKILSGQLEPSSGSVYIDPKARMSVLKQDQTMYDAYTVMDTVIMGNQRLYDCGKEKDAIYAKDEMTDEDGIRASELEEEFADLGGWEAESDASRILQGLGVSPEYHETMMSDMDPRLKVKVLLAQALFGHPDIILLDEPTNNLDLASVVWLEDFLMDYDGTVLVVSHDRYFLNNVCTHIVDIDYGKIKMYVGNYDFWYESSQLMQKLVKDQNKRAEQKIQELQTFIARFSANKSKSRQATSRRKLLEKISVEDMPASSRSLGVLPLLLLPQALHRLLQLQSHLTALLGGVRQLRQVLQAGQIKGTQKVVCGPVLDGPAGHGQPPRLFDQLALQQQPHGVPHGLVSDKLQGVFVPEIPEPGSKFLVGVPELHPDRDPQHGGDGVAQVGSRHGSGPQGQTALGKYLRMCVKKHRIRVIVLFQQPLMELEAEVPHGLPGAG